jgi:hypothetical protein
MHAVVQHSAMRYQAYRYIRLAGVRIGVAAARRGVGVALYEASNVLVALFSSSDSAKP